MLKQFVPIASCDGVMKRKQIVKKQQNSSPHEDLLPTPIALKVTWRTLRNFVHENVKVTWMIWKRVVLTAQHEAAKVNKKDLEKSYWNETGLDISYKSKKTAAA